MESWPGLWAFHQLHHLPPTFQNIRSIGESVLIVGVRVCMVFVSVQPCDGLATCPRCIPAS